MIFDTRYPHGIRNLKLINLPTSPVYCGYTTLRSVKSHYFNNVIHPFLQILQLGKFSQHC